VTSTARQGSVLVVWNRTAGTKVGVSTSRQPTEAELRAAFDRHGLAADLVVTESATDAVHRVRAACADGCSIVVAAGGDGTARAIARELLGSDTALGILPLGSVMNLARSLSIPRDLDAAVAIIARRQVRMIDVGSVGPLDGRGQPFFESVSIGLHAALFREGQRFDRGHRFALPRAAWIMLRYRPSKVWLELDDRRITTRALAISIANGPYAGLGFTVAPEARLDDGRFDIRIFRGFSRWHLVRHFASIVAGRRAVERRIETLRSARVRVFSRSPLPVRPDDDPPLTTPVSLEVLPRCLRVVVPADETAGDLADGRAGT
jgi:YegS/Rv2252/BmrU family lipid kinase